MLRSQVKTLLLTIESSQRRQGPPFVIDADEVRAVIWRSLSNSIIKAVVNDKTPRHLIDKGYGDFIECAYRVG